MEEREKGRGVNGTPYEEEDGVKRRRLWEKIWQYWVLQGQEKVLQGQEDPNIATRWEETEEEGGG
jgi:hypothetical protein